MNRWYKQLLFRILSSNLFSRRYFIYSNREGTKFFVKTHKIFTIPKYIHVTYDGYDYYDKSTIFLNKALKKLECSSKEEAAKTILLHKRLHPITSKPKYLIIHRE